MNTLSSFRLEHKLRRFFSLSPYDYYQSLKSGYLKAKSKKLFRDYLRNNKIKKLQIGCGYNTFNGWLNTDLQYKKNSIGFLDAGKRFPFKDNTFDFIYSEHIFEHLTFEQESTMLSECFRILKPNGIIRLATPNIQFLFQILQSPKEDIHHDYVQWSLNHFLPKIKSQLQFTEDVEIYVINNFFRAWDHQIIHSENSLKEFFKLSGFKEIATCKTGVSRTPELTGLERHENIVGARFNELETLIVEAEK